MSFLEWGWGGGVALLPGVGEGGGVAFLPGVGEGGGVVLLPGVGKGRGCGICGVTVLLSPVDVCTCEGTSDGCSVLHCGWHLCESHTHTHTQHTLTDSSFSNMFTVVQRAPSSSLAKDPHLLCKQRPRDERNHLSHTSERAQNIVTAPPCTQAMVYSPLFYR